MRTVWRRRTEERKDFVLEGPTLHTPRGSLTPCFCQGGVGGDGANVRVGGDSPGVAHGAELRRISTGRRRAVGTSTPLSRLWKIECRGVVDVRWVGGGQLGGRGLECVLLLELGNSSPLGSA